MTNLEIILLAIIFLTVAWHLLSAIGAMFDRKDRKIERECSEARRRIDSLTLWSTHPHAKEIELLADIQKLKGALEHERSENAQLRETIAHQERQADIQVKAWQRSEREKATLVRDGNEAHEEVDRLKSDLGMKRQELQAMQDWRDAQADAWRSNEREMTALREEIDTLVKQRDRLARDLETCRRAWSRTPTGTSAARAATPDEPDPQTRKDLNEIADATNKQLLKQFEQKHHSRAGWMDPIGRPAEDASPKDRRPAPPPIPRVE